MDLRRPLRPSIFAKFAILSAAGLALAALAAMALTGPARRTIAAGVSLQQFAMGLSSPLGIVNAGDGSGRVFVVEQTGTINVFSAAGTPLGTYLDVSSLISTTGGERGLLGLAFARDYETSGRFYIDYTNTSGDIVIARYLVSGGNANIADAGSAQPLLTIPHPGQSNHNGGEMQFGPDGYLYIGVGDGGGGGDPSGNAQNVNTLLGKILRIDVSGSGYVSPSTNPLFGPTAGLDQIWAIGVRNPWRFSFDRMTGDLFIGDVGQNTWEEVDFQPASQTALANYGWNVTEGNACYSPPSGCNMSGITLPILTYGHTSNRCSVTGGYRYRGSSPSLAGMYVYADYCTGEIWTASPSGMSWSSTPLMDTTMLITSFGEDEAGELYVTDAGAGTVYKFVDDSGVDTDGDGCSDARENGASHASGGQRDIDDPYDFFDVPVPYNSAHTTTGMNHAITGQDVLTVRDGTGHIAGDGTYNEQYDRTPSTIVGEPWHSDAPDGALSGQDVLVARDSTGDSCT